MEIITLPRLRIAELQSLTEATLKICTPLTEVEEQKQQVEKEFTPFKEGVLKNKARAEKKTVDKERDRYSSGFFFDIKAETYYPYTDKAAIETVNKLKALSKKYGIKINGLPYNEETAAIDNCMEEAEKIDLSPLTSPAIGRWIPLIKEVNLRFKDMANDFVEESTAVATLESASAVAPELIHAIEELIIQIFSVIRVSPTDALKKAYSELETLVDSYR
ncbi:MAG: DUF6261 family protein [Bacteroidales bacterium]|nr:DUF6261 family protein [Bacteroidales bacterium]